jgi:deazaflavin-dependent oxidoreductase (nitroreductase family)
MAYVKPGFVTRKIMNPLVSLFTSKPTLAVRGRRSGEWRTVPVNVVELDGSRYLVAPRGEAQWVRNLRAAGDGEIRRRRGTEHFRATEVDTAERAPIIAAYRERWNSEVKRLFDELPDPADHPVFRVTITDEGGPTP